MRILWVSIRTLFNCIVLLLRDMVVEWYATIDAVRNRIPYMSVDFVVLDRLHRRYLVVDYQVRRQRLVLAFAMQLRLIVDCLSFAIEVRTNYWNRFQPHRCTDNSSTEWRGRTRWYRTRLLLFDCNVTENNVRLRFRLRCKLRLRKKLVEDLRLIIKVSIVRIESIASDLTTKS